MATRTTTVTSTETAVNTAIRWDPNYIRTIPGILKCVCVVSRIENFMFCGKKLSIFNVKV